MKLPVELIGQIGWQVVKAAYPDAIRPIIKFAINDDESSADEKILAGFDKFFGHKPK